MAHGRVLRISNGTFMAHKEMPSGLSATMVMTGRRNSLEADVYKARSTEEGRGYLHTCK